MNGAGFGLAVILLSLTALAAEGDAPAEERLTPLPEPVSNNAVALVADGDGNGLRLYSMLGMLAGKNWRDTSSGAAEYSLDTGRWRLLADVPGPGGRLAASAAVVGGQVYLFGGYTVARDGSEVSTPGVYRLDRKGGQWRLFSEMPVSVEDSVLLVYQDRYIYLVSGWHNLGNVNLVQVLDTVQGDWSQATPYPGPPVFGHSGGIAGRHLLVCDGVRIEYPPGEIPRRFVSAPGCWYGEISTDNLRRIDWRPVDPHPGRARYRMAAGDDGGSRVVFAGGSVNPYNFDGIGYNGDPSEPESSVFSFDFGDSKWRCHGDLSVATMDHRGLPQRDGWFYIIGGMRRNQRVSDGVFRFRPGSSRDCEL